MRDKGNHECLSEDWLLDNLPKGWAYDCVLGNAWGGDGQDGFIIWNTNTVKADEGEPLVAGENALFIPLDLLERNRKRLG